MSDSKCQRLDAISGRDQMVEKPLSEHAKKWMKRPAYHNCSVLDETQEY